MDMSVQPCQIGFLTKSCHISSEVEFAVVSLTQRMCLFSLKLMVSGKKTVHSYDQAAKNFPHK
jgi:hypothetical protein